MTLEKADKKGYRPCSRCDPPTLGVVSEYDSYTYSEYRHRYDAPAKTSSASNDIAAQEKSKEGNAWKDYGIASVCILLFTPLGWIILELSADIFKKLKARRQPAAMVPVHSGQYPQMEQVAKSSVPAVKYNAEHQAKADAYREQYEGRSIWEMADVPVWAYFDCQNLPHTLDCGSEPDPFIVYVTEKGKCYHKPGCRLAASGAPVNLCIAIRRGKCACKSCKPMSRVPDFVKRYQHIKHIQSKYGIDMLP